jgi:Rps23 Pro-64 3,4-dihydroxylase Tpa1-like proline 4-hydroxylase
MTAKQILDSFSQTLVQDERILSPQERELLLSLLLNAGAVPSNNPEIQSAVTATIARSVGKTVAQRAFAVLGESVVEQILASAGSVTNSHDAIDIFATDKSHAPTPTTPPPQRPTPDKNPPIGPRNPQPPGEQPDGVEIPDPMPPSGGMTREPVQGKVNAIGSVAVADMYRMERARCVVLDEFLPLQELDELINYALQHAAEFQNSEVISPRGTRGVIDYKHRRSRVLTDLGKHQGLILKRIRGVLPGVFDRLGIEEFPLVGWETQITASNDGDFFSAHSDNRHETISSRRITFVFFFHREPRQFAGGELRLYDSRGNSRTGSYYSIVPLQNQVVFFPCSVLHEIMPVECPSQAFVDSRFTLNGWLHAGDALRDVRA